MRYTTMLLATVAALAAGLLCVRSDEPANADSRIVDSVTVGKEQDETNHNQGGEKSDVLGSAAVKMRKADAGGWFSYDLKVRTNGTQSLVVQIAVDSGLQSMDIWVGTNKLTNNPITIGGPSVEKSYYLGNAMIRRGQITVKFQASENAPTPNVASVKVMTPVPTIASMAKASSTRTNYQYIVNAVNDLREPKSSGENINYDRNAKAHFDWWPASSTNAWVQYDLAKTEKVSAVEVYWFDDSANRGGCRPPKSWTLYYRVNGEWKPVQNPSGFGVEKDKYNRTTFDPVETDGLKLDATMPDNRNSSGILQWKVE